MIIRHLLREFTHVAQAKGSVPVLLFIPQVGSDWSQGRLEPGYHKFKTQIQLERAFRDLVVIDVYDAAFDESRFSVVPFEDHASVYDNQAHDISRGVSRHLACCRSLFKSGHYAAATQAVGITAAAARAGRRRFGGTGQGGCLTCSRGSSILLI